MRAKRTVVAVGAVWACSAGAALWPANARAADTQMDSLKAAEGERPWAKGVDPEAQAQALELFRQGNGLLKDSVFVQAAAKYREALKLWDHPAIHYNLVLALLNLDQPVEVREHLIAAMRFGPAPLDKEKFEQAKGYKLLIEKQLAQLQVSADEPGAVVTLDGQPLFTAPGKFDGWVRAGAHSVVATKPGFVTNTMTQPLHSGEVTTLNLTLLTEDSMVEYRRRFASWIPWTVLAGGAVVAGAGGLMHYGASRSFTSFDSSITACGGCVPTSAVLSDRSTGTNLQRVAIGAYVVGGAAMVAGGVLLYINRLQPYRKSDLAEPSTAPSDAKPSEAKPPDAKPDAKPEPKKSADPDFSFLAYVGKGEGGLLAQLRF